MFKIWIEEILSNLEQIVIASRSLTSLHHGTNFKLAIQHTPQVVLKHPTLTTRFCSRAPSNIRIQLPWKCYRRLSTDLWWDLERRGIPLAFASGSLLTMTRLHNMFVNRVKNSLNINLLSQKHHFIHSLLNLSHHDNDFIKAHSCNMIKNLMPMV